MCYFNLYIVKLYSMECNLFITKRNDDAYIKIISFNFKFANCTVFVLFVETLYDSIKTIYPTHFTIAMVVINFHLLLHNYWLLTLCWQISLGNWSFSIDLYSWSNRKEKRRQRIRSFIIPDASLRVWLSSSRY